MKRQAGKPMRLREVPPLRAASRFTVQRGNGWRLINKQKTLYWKVDVMRSFGSKERYGVLRIRPVLRSN